MFLVDVGAFKILLACWWALLMRFVSISTLLQDCSLRGTIPLALILCLKASIKPNKHRKHNEGREEERRTRAILLFDKATAKLCRAPVSLFASLCHSQQIFSRCAAPLNRLIYLFVYLFPSSSPINIPSPSLILWIIRSIFTLSIYPSILPLLSSPALPPLHFLLFFFFFFAYLNCMKREWESIKTVIWNTGYR